MKTARQPLRIEPQAGPQMQFAATSADIAVFGGSSGGGKALSLDTPLPKADGSWTTMGDVCIGDMLLDNWAKPCTVTYVSSVVYDHQCYELSFGCGGSIVADAEHLWPTFDAQERQQMFAARPSRYWRAKPKTTQHIARTLMAFDPVLGMESVNHALCADVRPAGYWTGWNLITACDAVPSVPVRCITVDSDEHLYLASEGYVPTHNTFWLCCEPLRHVTPHKDGTANRFDAVIFRRTYKQITEAGGMWNETMHIYPQLRAVPKVGDLRWQFPGGAAVRFRHLQHEIDKTTYQGAQICLLCFDQLEQFSSGQFWYLLQRNRSMCGVKPYLRATCNPDPDCFLAPLLEWWINEDGYPIKERGGIIRYFARINEIIRWADSRDEIYNKYRPHFDRIQEADPEHRDPRQTIKSFTFIPASIYDNKILLKADPTYLANLYALPEIERERLLHGNWKIRPAAGKLFNRAWFPFIDALPPLGVECRFWDLAASKRKGADYTAGIKIRRVRDAYFIITDMIKTQMGPAEVDLLMLSTARADYENAKETATRYAVRWEIEPGSSGLRDDYRLREMLGAFNSGGIKPQGDKVVRAKPLAAASQRGDIRLLRGGWNEEWLTHMHHQPDWSHDDIMDASTGAYNALSGTMMTTEEVITMPWQSIGPAY